MPSTRSSGFGSLNNGALTLGVLTLGALTLGAAIHAPAACAQEPIEVGDHTPYSTLYTGSFLALGAFAGPSLTTMRTLEGAWSTSFGAWAQLSVPLQIVDLQWAYFRNDADTTFSDGRDLHFGQDTLSFGAALHPAFLLFLESDPLNTILGGAYTLVGIDVERITADFKGGRGVTEFDLGLQLGAGFDVPLDDYDDGGAFWLGLQYRFNEYAFDASPLRHLDVSQHLFFLRLSYRRNGLLIAL